MLARTGLCTPLGLAILVSAACSTTPDYLDFKTPTTVQAGGVRMIQLDEGYQVWTKRFGNSPMKVLILHGGPAATHEYLECFESFFPQANIEFYHYDQLGSYRSDQPDDDSLWTIERFVEEVEQVRLALGLNADNFFLLGNSWGGMLAMEYALKYQHNLKGLIVCNMTADFDKYEAYNAKLRAQLPEDVLVTLSSYEERGDYHDPVYEQLVFDVYYTKHLCRLDPWPEPVTRSFNHLNQHVYEYMQGPSEFVPGGILKGWSVWDRLGELEVPTLMVGAKHDTMNPAEMAEMATLVQNGRSLYCPNGSHMSFWDDQEVFMEGVIDFIHDVHEERFP
ncbi:MAG: proline iminopeptidase-family hydrolase [Planctomycetota bacterium]|nr:proline iminopeptidase-family hydrolase [Planctomycetota bacterium]